MDGNLSAACQMFLIPTTILFAALSAGVTHQLKTLLSIIGVATSFVWLLRIYAWKNLVVSDRRAALALAWIFLIAWLVALPVHAYWWWVQAGKPGYWLLEKVRSWLWAKRSVDRSQSQPGDSQAGQPSHRS